MMPIATKFLAALEQRMLAFVQSRGAKDERPIAMSLTNGLDHEIERILTQRFVLAEFLSGEHISDAHRMEQCYLCQNIFGNLRSKYQGHAYEFKAMNRDLMAEIELSH